jgi:hypothetical protein
MKWSAIGRDGRYHDAVGRATVGALSGWPPEWRGEERFFPQSSPSSTYLTASAWCARSNEAVGCIPIVDQLSARRCSWGAFEASATLAQDFCRFVQF